MIVASFVSTKHRNVTEDRQTDRRTDRRTRSWHIQLWIASYSDGCKNRIAEDITPRHTGQWELLTKRCMSTRKATLTRSASRQTSQDAEAEAGTTVAEAVVLLLAETGDRVLSSTSSNSYSYFLSWTSGISVLIQWMCYIITTVANELRNSVTVQPPLEYFVTALRISLSFIKLAFFLDLRICPPYATFEHQPRWPG